MSFYDICAVFLIYSFFGWCVEVVFAAANHGKFVNRGFLNGPVCPIYGFGVTFALICLDGVRDSFLLLYIFSVLLCSVLELITGYAMEKVFHHKWWDYSDLPLNIGGYICLKFSLLWGLACVAVVDVVHPAVLRLVELCPAVLGWIIIIVGLLVMICDTCLTGAHIFKLNRSLKQLEELGGAMRSVSDKIGQSVADKTMVITAAGARAQDELKFKYDDLKRKQSALKNKVALEYKRLFRAFPAMKSISYNAVLESIKTRYRFLRDKK